MSCGGGFDGEKAQGASVGDGGAALATHEKREELERAGNMLMVSWWRGEELWWANAACRVHGLVCICWGRKKGVW